MAIRAFIPTGGTGVQKQLTRLLPHLIDRGVDCEIVAGGTRRFPHHDIYDGISIRRSVVPGYSRVASAAFISMAGLRLARFRSRIDILHAQGAIDPGSVALLAHRLGIPTIVRVTRAGTRSDFVGLLERPWGAWQAQRLIETCWFIAQTSLIKQDLVRRDVPEERIFTIANGVDSQIFHPATPEQKEGLRTRLGLPHAPLIISTSRLIGVKQLDIAIKALRGVPDVHLVLVGDGDQRPVLEALSMQLGLGDRVTFVGRTKVVQDYLRASDIFVLPSTSEGMTNSLLEAMACGLVCVASPAVGGSEVFEGGAGVVVPDQTSENWGMTLRKLSETPAEAEEIGRRATARARTTFTLEAAADKMVEAYRHILSASSRHAV